MKKALFLISITLILISAFTLAEDNTTAPQLSNSTPVEVWYRNAEWQCYDGYNETSGGETSCKSSKVWQKYAQESCEKRCIIHTTADSNETQECGVNSFKIYNECSSNIDIPKPVCGNGRCEKGEGEVCYVIQKECKKGEPCEATVKNCKVVCPEDCKKQKTEVVKLNEKFKISKSQEVTFEDYPSLEIKFNDLFIPKCIPETQPGTNKLEIQAATITYGITGNIVQSTSSGASPQPNSGTSSPECEKYYVCPDGTKVQYCFYSTATDENGTVIGGGCGCKLSPASLCPPSACKWQCSDWSECVDGIQTRSCKSPETCNTENSKPITERSCGENKCPNTKPYAVLQVKINKDDKQKTEVVKLQLGEKKKVFDITINFLDYDQNTGVFVVAKDTSTFECPKDCMCDADGKVLECKIIEICPENQMLCPDGYCKEKCEISNITTGCKFGCFYQDKCLPYGIRAEGLYCALTGDMKNQATEQETCENSFECGSNVCVDGKCLSSNTIQKILNWFSKLFGGK